MSGPSDLAAAIQEHSLLTTVAGKKLLACFLHSPLLFFSLLSSSPLLSCRHVGVGVWVRVSVHHFLPVFVCWDQIKRKTAIAAGLETSRFGLHCEIQSPHMVSQAASRSASDALLRCGTTSILGILSNNVYLNQGLA